MAEGLHLTWTPVSPFVAHTGRTLLEPYPDAILAAGTITTTTIGTAPNNPTRARLRPSTNGQQLPSGFERRVGSLEEHCQRGETEAQSRHCTGYIPGQHWSGPKQSLQHRTPVDTEVAAKGKACMVSSGPPFPSLQVMPQGGVRLSGGPVLTDNEASMLESDASSIVDISDHFVASDTEDDLQRDELHDLHKYRLPDIGKTRLNLRTKEPLSPAPTPPRTSHGQSSTPSTPQTTYPGMNARSPGVMEYPFHWHVRNSSVETVSDNEFVRPSLSRAGSIYTLGRASFTGQLAQLTSMRLPDATSLSKRISSIPTAADAAKALSDASEQIRVWISKASDALDGLSSEDDVEWAAAGGREGIEDVNVAISRFEHLVDVYILSIERWQTREDIAQLSAEDIKGSVGQMESIIASWKQIKDTLRGVKEQVEIAMEWEVLWNTVLGEVAQEMDGLNQLVFEMEEKRHQGVESVLSSRDTIDLSELETIVEEQPGRGTASGRSRLGILSLNPNQSMPTPPRAAESREDSSLLALFARMQPLRADLDFLPMRLSAWQVRGQSVFPSACLDLEQRQEQLEAQWKKLESDAESLRRELGEDRWIMVFRNAGRQALKMCESITRSFSKLKDGIDANEQQRNPGALMTKVENYEQKKRHYGPAIERVLAIIDRGVLDRLTVNGEILRLQSDMKHRWTALQSEMTEMDATIQDVINERENALRDSVSTVISSERSVGSSLLETPGSSPASSVVGGSRKSSFGSRTPTPLTNIKTRSSSSDLRKRLSTSSSLPRKGLLSALDARSSPKTPASSIPTPTKQPAWPSRPEPDMTNKPRFHTVAKTTTRDFRPLSAFEPSPYAKVPVTPKSNYLRSTARTDNTPHGRTPAPRIVSAPVSSTTSSLPRPTTTARGSSRRSLGTVPPVPALPAGTPSKPERRSLAAKVSAAALRPASRGPPSGRRSSLLPAPPPVDGNEADSESPSHHRTRPPSALASGRKSSLLTGRPRSRLGESASASGHPADRRPKWRP